jgi:hypothetical protein
VDQCGSKHWQRIAAPVTYLALRFSRSLDERSRTLPSAESFLPDFPRRPLSIADSKGAIPRALFLGQGSNGLEVAVLDSTAQPTVTNLRAIWNSRLAGRATPLLVMVLHGKGAALCGPLTGISLRCSRRCPSTVWSDLCRAALAEPDRNAALRFLAAAMPEADAPIPGVRNEGLFATHELQKGVPKSGHWGSAGEHSIPLLNQRGEKLLERLGYSIQAIPGPVSNPASRREESAAPRDGNRRPCS